MHHRKNKVAVFLHSVRMEDWIISFIPQIFGFCYFFIYYFDGSFNTSILLHLLLFVVSSIGFAAFGYYINDFYDLEIDRKAGKKTVLGSLTKRQKRGLLFSSIICMFSPWILLPANEYSIALIVSEVVIFFLYSHPLFRLKENWILSIIIDSLYAYTIPFTLCLVTFSLYYQHTTDIYLLFITATFFIAGCRNIIVHQLSDYDNDRKVGIQLIPHVIGIKKTKSLVYFCMWIEVGLLFVIWLLYAYFFHWTYALFLLIIVLYSLIHLFKKTEKRLLFPNYYYQVLLPVTYAILLISIDLQWIYFIIPYLIIFHYNLLHWITCRLRSVLSKIVNYSIYYFLLIFGINLKKEKKSVYNYLKRKRN
ncbi:UbiA family prenyltransferase [Crocinitomicaceae bacterium CZZ-1]|uniref:UbiA family prenyltransferase n=1 Tax=Taishania pollutisoli TaxID=2766479 RepID=A0A8J6TYK2_9FLAO|nr:UbiA family prenyltransferase [Taishania pollutisoli]MBC9811123.1 UbiA family prenyltransferase [Taishania pollutisoli]MBX2947961.1 UbiA family prenyltransferase [Crocinitomicaceae bacterium]